MPSFQSNFDLKPEPGLLTFRCAERPECLLVDSGFSITLQQGDQDIQIPLRHFTPAAAVSLTEDGLDMGSASLQAWAWTDTGAGLDGVLELLASEDGSFLAVRLRLHNFSAETRIIKRIDLLKAGSLANRDGSALRFSTQDHVNDLAFFSNGWQSWSYSAAFGAGEKQPKPLLSFIPNSASANPLTPAHHSTGRFNADFFGVIGSRTSRVGLLSGFLSEKQFFGCCEADLRGEAGLNVWVQGDQTELRSGASLLTDWLYLAWVDLDDMDPLQGYLELVGRFNQARIPPRFPSGWCSWYHYETDISEEKIQANLRAVQALQQQLPLELVQIDDGFATLNGDWFDFRPGFPNGIAPLAQQIKQSGRMSGLWLAPFIAGVGAQLIRQHPEYILKTRRGGMVNAGFISNRFAAALNISYPPALEYAAQVIHTAVQEWGFPYLKLDFLYAPALDGKRHDPTRTRAQILRKGLETLREAAGEETFLLGCGVPLGSSVGIFDGLRIGEDTAGFWKPKLFNIPWIFTRDPQIPSTRNAVQNTLTRASMHNRLWANDPDCLLLRPDTELTLDEIKSHASLIALSGGALLISDDLTRLPAERLRLAAVLLPLIGQRPQVLDWFDRQTPRFVRLDLHGPTGDWHLLGYFNWSDQPEQKTLTTQEFHLAGGPYTARSFWESTILKQAGNQLWSGQLAPHGCVVLAVRLQTTEAQYLGSDLHISQGLEVKTWQVSETGIRCEINLERLADGYLDIQLPGPAIGVCWQGQELIPQVLGDQIIRCPIQVDGSGWLEITLQ